MQHKRQGSSTWNFFEKFWTSYFRKVRTVQVLNLGWLWQLLMHRHINSKVSSSCAWEKSGHFVAIIWSWSYAILSIIGFTGKVFQWDDVYSCCDWSINDRPGSIRGSGYSTVDHPTYLPQNSMNRMLLSFFKTQTKYWNLLPMMQWNPREQEAP
jgi:hypothetical protein